MKPGIHTWQRLAALARQVPREPDPDLSVVEAGLMVARCTAGCEADLVEIWRLFCRRALLAATLCALICGTWPRPAAQQETSAEAALLDQIVQEALQ